MTCAKTNGIGSNPNQDEGIKGLEMPDVKVGLWPARCCIVNWLQAHVINPHLTNLCFANDLEF